MIRKLLKKIAGTWSKQADERVAEQRAETLDDAEALNPGHGNQAGQIGMFS
ncbi:MAG TPA: hypothetical protein VE615_01925 [Gaiellaceae bacterium]|nr:hypothetical protein [Gaiellaceae bacterium]